VSSEIPTLSYLRHRKPLARLSTDGGMDDRSCMTNTTLALVLKLKVFNAVL